MGAVKQAVEIATTNTQGFDISDINSWVGLVLVLVASYAASVLKNIRQEWLSHDKTHEDHSFKHSEEKTQMAEYKKELQQQIFEINEMIKKHIEKIATMEKAIETLEKNGRK